MSGNVKTVRRVGLAGLGVVGSEVFRFLQKEALQNFCVTAVSARQKNKNRGIDVEGIDWVENPIDLASREDVDIVVELMGGHDDPAYSLVKAALTNGKTVVTANKALLAHHGLELASIAENQGTGLFFEAAVAGGIPIIKMLREGLSANKIDAIYGILNGTCNYILTTMEKTGESFESVLSDAQKLGYAESDPSLDVDGGDTGHKLSLLSTLAFGVQPDIDGLTVNGIRQVSAADIKIADELGYKIKLVGQAQRQSDARILRMVSPTFVPKTCPLAHVGGVLNGVLTEGDMVGQSFVSGRGAGAKPTASAVLSDLQDVLHGKALCPFVQSVRSIVETKTEMLGFDDWNGAFYLRLSVKDEIGVIAELAPVLRDAGLSIESLIQRGHTNDGYAFVMMTTHPTFGKNIRSAIQNLGVLGCVMSAPLAMPILKG